ncbi:T9SS type A sorting domain-containing protein [Adhaeribacter swui]|uniref:T9SS type A sorting domain-containing protein n=1 Tax=Adhaeribacter swui TaxID=2086471 RepID=A0A7G7G519_9BACT|nr:T9SS type A sorting domain-containing protein [Adhaeribacter swui]QNF32253.1 T9SS type A sorting domain-containing protein [Adhaeribacter swui]
MKAPLSIFYLVQQNRVFPRWRHLVSAILLLLLGLPMVTFAQNKIWDKTFGTKNQDVITSWQQTQDGGFILGGYTDLGIKGDPADPDRRFLNYWVIKLKADGTKEWDKTYGGRQQDELAVVQQTQDGGYILGGTSSSIKSGDKSQDSRGNEDYWIVKLDANGNKVWDKTYGGSNYDYLTALQQTQDGGYLVGGSSESSNTGDKTEKIKTEGLDDYWVLKLRADGTKEWDRTIGGNSTDELIALAQTQDGGYILGGSSGSEKGFDKSENGRGDQDYWLVKLKADGSKLWDKTFGGDQADYLASFRQTQDGGYILAGSSGSGISGDKSEASKGGKNNPNGFGLTDDYWVVKLRANGTKVWDKTIGGNGDDRLTSVQQTQDGGYLLGGWSLTDLNGDKTEILKKIFTPDYWIVKLQADGQKAWDRSIGGEAEDYLQSVKQISDGSYVLAGNSNSGISGDKSQANLGASDFWLVKLENTIRQNQSIFFTSSILLNRALGDAPFALEATASSGLPVSYRVISGPATISGNTIKLTGVGSVHIQAYQPGNATYNATVIDRRFTVEEKKVVQKKWDRTYGGSNRDILTSLIPTPDGGYIAGGYSRSGKTGDKSNASKGATDYWLVKLNSQGTKVWDKAYGGNAADSLTALIATPDGGYLLGGYSVSGSSGDKSQGTKGSSDYWVVKTDADGTKIWDRTFGGNSVDKLTALAVAPDGGYLLAGSSASIKSGDKSQFSQGSSDYWIVKIDTNGKKLWDRTYGGNASDRLAALVVAPEGGYLLGGTSASGKSGDKSEVSRGFEDYWIVRLNADGSKQWDKTYGGLKERHSSFENCDWEGDLENCFIEVGSSTLTSLITTADGGYLLGGYSNAEQGAEKSDANQGTNENNAYYHDYWVVKINDKGVKAWDKTYGGLIYSDRDNGGSYLASITTTPDGNYILAGTSNSEKGKDKTESSRVGEPYPYPVDEENGIITAINPSRNDYWVLKINTEGTKKWDRTLGSRDYDTLQVVVPTPDGGFLLGGSSVAGIGGDKTAAARDTTNPFSQDQGDFWLVKIADESVPLAKQWNMRYGGMDTDNFTSVIKTSDGGYLSGGYTNSAVSGDKTQGSQGKNDYWIVKSDKNGYKLWDKRFGGNDQDYLNRVIQTADGGYLLAGSSFSGKSGDKSEGSKGNRDFWVIKTDALGNKQWDKTYGGTGEDELEKVVQLASGEYVLGGYSSSPVSGDKTQSSQGGTDFWLVKISATGIKIWDKRYGGTANEDLGSFTETSDGGFFLGGSTVSGKGGDKTQSSRGASDFWAVKTDKDGNLVWEKTFGGDGQDGAFSVRQIPDGNFYLAGSTSSKASGEVSQTSRGELDYWLIKLDKQGTKLWDKRFGGSKNDVLRASTYTNQGHYILAGTSYSNTGGDKTQDSQGAGDYWVVEVDENGNKVQDQRYGGNGEDELRTITPTKDGGLLLGGRSNSGVSGDRTQPSQGSTDYWLVKVAPANAAQVAAQAAPLGPEEPFPAELTHLAAYPNPFQERVTVRFSLLQTQAATLRILDNQGQPVATLFQGEAQANKKYEVEWQAGKQENGLYLLQLQTSSGQNTQKLILAK